MSQATTGEGGPVHVLVTLPFDAAFLERIAAADPRLVIEHHPVADEGDPAAAVPAEVLARTEVMYTSSVLPGPAEAPRLRWAQLDTSGVDHVRGTELWESDVVITTLGGISPAPLAEWVLMMVLADAHHLPRMIELQRDGIWPSREERWRQLMPRNLRTSTIAVIGYGRIGQEIARMAQAFGMHVIGVRRGGARTGELFGSRESVDGVEILTTDQLEEALSRADYIAVTVPLTPQTEGMLGATELTWCKDGSMLVNGSRGGVVDEAALAKALDRPGLRAVASDVFDVEPLPADHDFWADPRFIISPHVAGFAPDYEDAVTALFTTNLRRYLDGEPLLNIADRKKGY